jgi:type IV pilus assembly protein PilQ
MKCHSSSHRTASPLALAAAALLVGASAAALQAAETNTLKSVDVRPLPGQQLQLTLHLTGPAPQPLSFTIDNPARISIDLPHTTLALPSRRIDVNSGGVDEVVAVEAKDRTRLVLDLDRMMPYTTQVAGNDIFVTVGQNAAGGAASPVAVASATSAAAAGAPAARTASSEAPVAPGGSAAAEAPASADASAAQDSAAAPRAIRSIDFRRSADGAGRVVVKLANPHTEINLRQVGNQIVVDFAGTEAPAALMRRYDATDFGTPVTGFDVTRSGDDTEIVINAKGDYEQLA